MYLYHLVQSFPMTDLRPRAALLDAAIEHVAANGITDLSLRGLAAELGTSHRMLSHHFGSKDGLWTAIVQEVERRQLDALAEVVPDPDTSPSEVLRLWWKRISDESLWPNERLFFEIYGQALRGKPPTSELLDTVVDSWLETSDAMAAMTGMSYEHARTMTRLGLAVTRGLLLDLLTTGDRAGVDAAMEQWIELNASAIDRFTGDRLEAEG